MLSNKSRLALSFSTLIFTLFVTGCGPKVRISAPQGTQLPVIVAVLPSESEPDIPRERIDLIRADFISELRNNGFIVVEDRVVSKVCKTQACPERSELAKKLSLQGFISLNIESLTRNNFFAGYYNSLAGRLAVQDVAGTQLATVEYTERERGGIIFESGQIIEGIISQIRNSDGRGFDRLASKFVRKLVSGIPRSRIATPAFTETEPVISEVSASWISAAAVKICLQGAPGLLSSALVNGERATLREVSYGEYCAAFSSLALPAKKIEVKVELRSAFGASSQRTVPLPLPVPCEDSRYVGLRSDTNSKTLHLKCGIIGKDASALSSDCVDGLPFCSTTKLILFQAPTSAGPFKKLKDVTTAVSSVPVGTNSLQVVAISRGGVPSLPIELTEK